MVAEGVTRRRVIKLVSDGEASEKTLKVLAERVRDELTAVPEISQVDVAGIRRYEISIEVSENALRRYGLSFRQVAAAVRGASLDLPGGSVKTQGGEILLRVKEAFGSLSLDVLAKNNEAFLQLAREALTHHTRAASSELEGKRQLIDRSIEAMRSELQKVEEMVTAFERDRQKKYGELAEQLKNSVKNYVPERCSIAFSGGLDSSIIAHLALQLGKKIELIVVGVEGCMDFEQALEAAEILGTDLKKIPVHKDNILETVQSLIEILPQRSLMDLSLASIFHIVSRNSTTRNIVAGQGADELFGGYWKYVEMFRRIGEKVNEHILRDLENLYITNLERDELAVASAKSTLTTPYLTRRIYELSKSIELKMKLREVDGEIVRKWILRKAAEALGVPEKLRLRPKKAAQYGSGIFKIVKKLFEEGLLTERSTHP